MKKKTRRMLAMVLVMAMALRQSGALGALALETEPGTEPAATAETSVYEAETQGAVEKQHPIGDGAETVPETKDSENGKPQTAESETAAGETILEEQQAQAVTEAEERVTEAATDSLDAEAGTPTETGAEETEIQTESGAEETGIQMEAVSMETEGMTEAATETVETLGETEMETEPVSEEAGLAVAEPQTYKYEDSKVVIKVAVPEGVELPYGSELKAKPISEGSKEYADAAAAVEAANPDVVFHGHVFYDIYFESDGKEVEPAGGEVSVQIKLKDALKTDVSSSGEPAVTVSHLKDDGSLEDVTDEVNLNKKDEVKSVSFSTDSFSIMGISTGVRDGYMTGDTLGDYSLEFLLRNFNLVSFGNVDMTLHCMGGILVEGDLSGSASGFADSEFITEESFVKGYVSFMGRCNSRNHYRPDAWAFYVGSGNEEHKNEIKADSNGSYTILNGMNGFNSLPDGGCGPVLMNDNYVNWTKLYNSVDGTMDSLAAKSVNTYTSDWDWSEITIPAGTNVSLNTNGHKVKIKLDGDTTATTIINVLDSGEVIMPQIVGPSSKEDGDSMPVTFTFPNATQVNIVSELSPSFGHVIAPDATIDIGSCNYNGCVIGGNMTISGEGHMWPYTGGSLIPASGGFSARKTVDGKTPAADQTFSFTLEELKDGAWTEVETKSNNGSKVEFSKILYTDTAEHWYLISEEAGSGNYDYDESVYAIHVTVEESESDGLKVYNVKDTEYYKVNDGVDKDSLISGNTVDASKISTVSGSDAVEFDNKELTRKEVQKVWAGDTDDVRPDSIQVQLKADGKDCGPAVTLNAANSWHYAWEKLAKYDGANEIAYTVSEVGTAAGYVSSSSVSGDMTTITNTYDVKDTEMHVHKVWVDDNDRDGLRPDSITVQLYADGTAYGAAVTLNTGNGWEYDWTRLPEKKDGKDVFYDVKEVGTVTGYTTAYQTSDKTVVITNTHDIAKTSKSVVKVWEDDGNRDGQRPDSIQVQLYADGTAYDKAVTLNAGNGWKYDWTELPEKKDGKTISYDVKEVGTVTGYTTAYQSNGNTVIITNTHDIAKTSRSVIKVWMDDNNRDGLRPESINVQLKADGANYGPEITLDEGNGWSHTWDGLPQNAAGAKIAYTVVETSTVTGYATTYTVDGAVTAITNTHEAGYTSMGVRKVWEDDDNRDNLRPDSIEVQLYADQAVYGDAVTLNAENGWSYSWDNLPEKANGKTVVYDVKEVGSVIGYTAAYKTNGNVVTITNKHDIEKTSKSVKKVWNDDGNRDGLRPVNVSVQLKADGKDYGPEAELNEDNGWSYSWTGLPVNNAGKPVAYTVTEISNVESYTMSSEVDGDVTTITNSHDIEKTSKSVQKVWDDDGDRDGLRPESIEIQLKADGEPVGDAVALNTENGWSFHWTGLPVNNSGKAIRYTVEEIGGVKGYTAAYADEGDTFTITNTHEADKTEATVRKFWDDEEDKDQIRPDAVTLTLYADGEPTDTTVTLNEANQWTATVTGLPKNTKKGGKTAVIAYTWEETEVPAGYEVTCNSTDGTVTAVTNTHVSTATYEVEKVWADADDKDGIRPDSIAVQLLADGKAFGDTAALNAGNDWHYTWMDLPEKKDGKLVVYTAKEVSVPEGYETSYENTRGKTVITNTHMASTEIVLTAKKAFDGAMAAGQFSFKLEEIGGDGITMTAANAADGSVSFDKIVYDKAGIYRYNISEVIPDQRDAAIIYDTSVKTVTVTVTEEDGILKAVSNKKDADMTFTNHLTSVSVSKTDISTGAELEGAHIQILDKDGNVVEEWVSGKTAYEVRGLKVGETYKLHETVAPAGYSVTADTEFVLNEDGTVDTEKTTAVTRDGVLLVEDSLNRISLRKVDENGNILSGAKLIIKDAAGTAVSEAWTSTQTPYEITGLASGDYVLSEIEAPAGYRVAVDVPFTVTGTEKEGTVIEVVMADTRIPENDKRSLTVTKSLMLDGISAPLTAHEMTYYVALFSDEAKTQRVSDVKALYFHDSSSSSVTFDNLGKGTYYVGETDENGTLLVSKVVNEQLDFYPEYESDKVTFTGRKSEAGSAEFTNIYMELPPSGFYLSGEITLTKRVLLNGEVTSSDDVFYARLYSDEALTQPVSDVVALDMAGGTSASVTLTNLFIGMEVGDSMVYYVAETDEYGNPLDISADLAFDVTIDNQRIALSGDNSSQEAVITNSFTTEEVEETEPIFESEVEVQEAPKTGDSTNFTKYLLLMSCSAAIAAVVLGQKYRKKRRTKL